MVAPIFASPVETAAEMGRNVPAPGRALVRLTDPAPRTLAVV